MPTNKVIKGRCAECGRHVTIKARGLCAPCYLRPDVRDRHAAMAREVAGSIGGKKRQAGWRATAGAAVGEYMPMRVFAVVRVMRSAISGRLPVLLKWFPERDKAIRFARKHAREFTLRVYEWVGTGDSWHAGIGRRMIQTRVAVARRRVAA